MRALKEASLVLWSPLCFAIQGQTEPTRSENRSIEPISIWLKVRLDDFCLRAILGSVKRVLLPASLAFAVVATRL